MRICIADHDVNVRSTENAKSHDGTGGGGQGVAEMRERKMDGRGLPSPQVGFDPSCPKDRVFARADGWCPSLTSLCSALLKRLLCLFDIPLCIWLGLNRAETPRRDLSLRRAGMAKVKGSRRLDRSREVQDLRRRRRVVGVNGGWEGGARIRGGVFGLMTNMVLKPLF